MSAMSPECLSERQWRERLAHRFDPERTEPETWPQDLDHLDRCDRCRERAVEVDPSVLFQRLAAPVPAFDAAAEVASMQRAVAALRRAERVTQPERRKVSDAFALWTIGGRWAAAALVAMTALSLGAGVWSGEGAATAPYRAKTQVKAQVKAQLQPQVGGLASMAPVAEWLHEEATLQEALDSLPLIEPVDTSATGAVGAVEDSLIWETDEMALIWVGDSEGPQDV